jgi:CBS domain-containing protein
MQELARRCEDLMREKPMTIDAEASIESAAQLMRRAACRHLVVLQGGSVVGVLSRRDLAAAGIRFHSSTQGFSEAPVRRFMSQPPLVALPSEPLAAAAARMSRHHVSSLPVLDGGRLVGIVTVSELVRHARLLLERDTRATGVSPKVMHLMTPLPIVTAQRGDRIEMAEALMRHGLFRHLPVLDGDVLVGILCRRDVIAALRSVDEGPCVETTVRTIMTRPTFVAAPDDDAALAAELLATSRVEALPVVRGTRLVGIVTESDFLSYVMQSARRPARAYFAREAERAAPAAIGVGGIR